VSCRFDGCPGAATVTVLTPFGTPGLCYGHGVQVASLYDREPLSERSPAQREVQQRLIEAMRFGPPQGGRVAAAVA
jgi:hypothetical protein